MHFVSILVAGALQTFTYRNILGSGLVFVFAVISNTAYYIRHRIALPYNRKNFYEA